MNVFLLFLLLLFVSCDKNIKSQTSTKLIKNEKEIIFDEGLENFDFLHFPQEIKNIYKNVDLKFSQPSKNPTELYKNIKSSVVSIKFYIDFNNFSLIPKTFRNFFNESTNSFCITGILVDKKYILTFYSILKDASVIFVEHKNKNIYLNIKGFDEKLNIALLELEEELSEKKYVSISENLTFLQGQYLYLLGNHNSTEQSFLKTQINFIYFSQEYNTISHLYSEKISSFFNNGSVLFTENGDFAGIVTNYDSNFENSSVILTSNVIKKSLTELIKGKNIFNEVWLGIYLKQENNKIAVKDIIDESSAIAEIDLKKNDIILQINDTLIKDVFTFKKVLSYIYPGNYIRIRFLRGKQEFIKKFKAVKKNLDYFSNFEKQNSKNKKSIGIKIKQNNIGILIDDIEEGSIGFLYGLKKGDCLLALNQTDIKSEEEYYKIIESMEENQLLRFKITRDKKIQYIAFRKP